MSFIITVHVREGLVMASDSRLTLNMEQRREDQTINHVAVGMSDSNYKTFVTRNSVGISTAGDASIQGVPIGGFIESFMREHIEEDAGVETTARNLMEHFAAYEPRPNTAFHVAGYEETENEPEQQIWSVQVGQQEIVRVNENQQGAVWGGEGDILSRIVNRTAQIDEQNNVLGTLPHFVIPYQFFTLQDAIDFAFFAVRSTIDAIRFQPRPKSVGGPIDVLVIKPGESFWIARKELKS